MKKYTKDQLIFQPVNSKSVQATFDGGMVTSDAGVLFIREIDRQLGLTDALAEAIYDRRDHRYTKHLIQTMISQRTYQIVCGYEDADDSDTLRFDPALKMAVDHLPLEGDDLASQPTISRLENSVTRSDLYRMSEVFVEQFINSYEEPPEVIVLDFDHTDDETHGKQQLTLFNGYYDEYCYLPLHVYEGLSGKLITTILRPGKTPSGKENMAIAKRIVRRIREAWPLTIIIFRADNHFAQPQLLDWLEDNRIIYVVGLRLNPVLQRLAKPLVSEAHRVLNLSPKTTIKLFDSLLYQAGSWRTKRRVVLKAEVNELGESARCVVTNLQTSSDEDVYVRIYCRHGEMENFIKDHKVHLKSDRTSCTSFLANQFRLFIHSAAYVLLHAMRQNLLRGSELARAQFDTIRLKLLKVGARVRELKTIIRIHLPTSFPLKSLMLRMNGILQMLPAP